MASPKTLALYKDCPKPTRQWNWISTDVKVGEKGKMIVKAQGTKAFGDNAAKCEKSDILSTMTRKQVNEAKRYSQRQKRAKNGGAFGKPQ